jgi:putative heme-binding domain-containing protein
VHLVPAGLYPLHLKDIGTQHPRLGDPLPAVSLFPAVALSGLMRYEGAMFPGEMHGNLFAAEHNSRKVSRHVLVREGSTFRAEAHEFLSTDDPDLHPSDVLQAPDGSMLVLDTGSWYIHHCPTGRIRKSPAAGGIYRVRFKGKPSPPVSVEDETKTVWRGDVTALRTALTNGNPNVAAAAARGLALRRDGQAAPLLLKLLSSSAPQIRCASAEALAHCGAADALAAIWRELEAGPDRFFEHALSYAAHHLADANALKAALNDGSARVQKAALLLLSQPPRAREDLDAAAVLSRVHSTDESLRRTALQILQNRPEWTQAAQDLLHDWAKRESLSDSQRTGFRELALAFKTDPNVQAILASAIKASSVAALETVEQAALPKTPQVWIEPLRSAILDRSVRAQALKAARTLHTSSLDDTIAHVADDPDEGNALRLQALGILIARTPKLSEDRLRFLLEQLRGDPLPALVAADVLRRAHLDSEQLNAALKALPAQSIVVPGSLIGSLQECTSPASVEKLLETIAPFASSLSAVDVAALESKLPPEVRPRVEHLKKRKDRESSQVKLEKFAPLLEGGDAQRGRAIFFDARTACATCHAIGSEGSRIGPDLTTVGAIRSGRDILESILLPSSTFAQTYEPYLVVTADGRELTGTLARQEADSVLLREATGSELQLPRSVIRELRRQEISIMPEGLESSLSEREFRDLIAFLQSLK